MKKSFVSILVPVYGVEKFIERCARSLFEQTYDDIEYIFVDDCSPDRSIEILKKVIDDYPQRKHHVRIIQHEHNRGLAAARNTAVENCHTEFLMHVDSDDYIELDTVASCLEKQQEEDSDIVTFDLIKHYKKYDENRRQMEITSPKDFVLKLLDGRCAHGVCGNLIRKKLYTDNGIQAIEEVNMAEDYLVMPRLAYCAKNVTNLHRALYHYNCENVNSYVFSFSKDKSLQQIRVFEELFRYFSRELIFVNILRTQYCRSLLGIMKKAILSNDREFTKYIKKKVDALPLDAKSDMILGDRIALLLGCTSLGKAYVRFAYVLRNEERRIRRLLKNCFSSN